MTDKIRHGALEIARVLHDFVNNEALPGTGISPDRFWAGAERIIHALAPRSRALVAERAALQGKIDDWHRAAAASRTMLNTTAPSSPTSVTWCPRARTSW
jgi:malate synthase